MHITISSSLITFLFLLEEHTSACPFFNSQRNEKLSSDSPKSHRRLLLRESNTEQSVRSCPRPPSGPSSGAPTAIQTGSPAAPSVDSTTQPTNEPIVPHAAQLPNPQCMSGPLVSVTPTQLCGVVTSIKQQFGVLMKSADNKFKSRLFGASLRLCFHDAGEVLLTDSTDRLGMDGCLQTVNRDNSGLIEQDQIVNTFLEPIWQQHCSSISRADFWALWGKLVIELSASIPVSVDFYFGRFDNTDCSAGAGRLPMASGLLDEVHRVFVVQMGLTLEDAVTLIGAHTIGHMSTSFSGFGNPPTDPRSDTVDFNAWDLSSWILDHDYFRALVGAEWTRFEFNGSQAYSASPSMPLMMLNTDMSIAYALDVDSSGQPQAMACGGSQHCARELSTLNLVNAYASSNDHFVSEFAKSFTKMCNVGYSYDIGSEQVFGKLGHLSKLDCVGI